MLQLGRKKLADADLDVDLDRCGVSQMLRAEGCATHEPAFPQRQQMDSVFHQALLQLFHEHFEFAGSLGHLLQVVLHALEMFVLRLPAPHGAHLVLRERYFTFGLSVFLVLDVIAFLEVLDKEDPFAGAFLAQHDHPRQTLIFERITLEIVLTTG